MVVAPPLADAPLGCAADLLPLLKSTFGFDGFRGAQAEVLDRVMAGASTLAVMPTGAGKSLCYQLPAVAQPGTVVVISPLIALMHDQLRSAQAAGIRAASLTSADTDRAETIRRLLGGELDLLYVAPERASQPQFTELLAEAHIALFAIDEAHCVSEWGHDFRPDYRLLRPLLDRFGGVPRLALTATADAATRSDVLHQLGIPAEGLIVAGFDRPNIRYGITPRDGLPRQLAELLARQPGAGIVYAPTRDKAERIAAQIGTSGRAVRVYHAGLSAEERAANQAAFVASEDMVMVATVAFGMGIDKPDVRFVAHAALPKSIEAYYQETGRAGRDGDPAEALLFWGAQDFAFARQRLAEVPEARRDADRQRLGALAGLVEATGCRRQLLLAHFGEGDAPPCGNCDTCQSPPAAIDVTELAQKLLSAVYRTGQSYGLAHITRVLTGDADEKVRARGHDMLSVFGIVDAASAPLLRPLARALLARDALNETAHGGLALGPLARPVLRGEERFSIAAPAERRARRARGGGLNPVGDPLFDALRARRRALAEEAGVPPYVIFHDSVLRDMAGFRPATLEALGALPGIGASKLERWGEDFLAVIAAH